MSEHLDPPPFDEIARRGQRRERRRRTVLGGVAVVLLVVVGAIGWQSLDREETRVVIPADRPTTTSIGQIVGLGGRTCRDVERDAASGTTTIPAPPPTLVQPPPETEIDYPTVRSRDGSDIRVVSRADQTHASIVMNQAPSRRTLYTAPPEARITAVQYVPGSDSVYFVLAGADGKSSLRRFDAESMTPDPPDVVLPEVRTVFFTVSPDETKVAFLDQEPQQLVIAPLDGGERATIGYGVDSAGDNFGWDHTSRHLWIQLDREPAVVDCRTGQPGPLLADARPGSHYLQTHGWITIGWIDDDATTVRGVRPFDVEGTVVGTLDLDGAEVVAIRSTTSSGDVAELVDPTTGATVGRRAVPAEEDDDRPTAFTFQGQAWVVDD